MSRFIAIPVGQGDAFYLERNDFSVLVDGGRSRLGFSAMFQSVTERCTERYGADIVICTHNDADHVNGIMGFLEGGLECGEVWLPGRWLATLPNVLRPFANVFSTLRDDIEREHPDIVDISEYGDILHKRRSDFSQTNDDSLENGKDGWPQSCLDALEAAATWEEELWGIDRLLDWHVSQQLWLSGKGIKLLWSAIGAANRIRTIALLAFHRGIPVRWFEYDIQTPMGGIRNVLEPINAREIAVIRPIVGSLFSSLSLTTANKESLVFWSPPTEQHPGVLFTADSDLSGAKLPPSLANAIVTAPHHGSENNANAYMEIKNCAATDYSTIIWVRSDGRYRTRPGNTYRGLAHRLCTLCRPQSGAPSQKQAVCLIPHNGIWKPHGTHLCIC